MQDSLSNTWYDKAYVGTVDSYYLQGNFKKGLLLAEELYERKPQSEFLSLIYLSLNILRNEKFCSSVKGLYPIGEGAGYAGGIVSAALDGIKAVEAILNS